MKELCKEELVKKLIDLFREFGSHNIDNGVLLASLQLMIDKLSEEKPIGILISLFREADPSFLNEAVKEAKALYQKELEKVSS